MRLEADSPIEAVPAGGGVAKVFVVLVPIKFVKVDVPLRIVAPFMMYDAGRMRHIEGLKPRLSANHSSASHIDVLQVLELLDAYRGSGVEVEGVHSKGRGSYEYCAAARCGEMFAVYVVYVSTSCGAELACHI